MYNTQSFRPQQGLPIMNGKIKMEKIINFGFRPQQGLPIMNRKMKEFEWYGIRAGFRPQQGLPIMNPYLQNPDKHYLK